MLQYECDLVKELKKETVQLREKLSTMEGYKTWLHPSCVYDWISLCCCSIQKVLTSSREEVDVLVKNYQSTSQLASFLVVLRRDYDALKASKSAVKKENDKLSQEITYLKRKVHISFFYSSTINMLLVLVNPKYKLYSRWSHSQALPLHK